MRVISGSARGTKLNSIDDLNTRPTLDRVKESLFNIIQNYITEETTVLDLFAGSGAIGIEFLSRGAGKTIFSDNSYNAINMINQNLSRTHLTEKARVINKDYVKILEQLHQEEKKIDIIYIDPPYKKDMAVKSLILIEKNELLKNDGIVIIETDEYERDAKEIQESCKDMKIYDVRKYGRATLIFLNKLK